jgi:hypothetical protein
MPSKGTPVHTLRLPADLVEQLDLAIARLQLWHHRQFFRRQWKDWSRSAFIASAIREKLKKMERSRRRPTRAARQETWSKSHPNV